MTDIKNQKYPNKIYLLVIPILIAVLLVIVNKSSPANNINTDQTKKEVVVTNIDNLEKSSLTITPDRCRGCGKCVKIDSEHFEMKGRIATVISQNNLNSSSLVLAINNCPTRVISLN